MEFIEEHDLHTWIKKEYLRTLTEGNPEVLDRAEKGAIRKMKSKLSKRFDMEAEFSLDGEDRDDLLVEYVCALIIHAVWRKSPRQTPEDVLEHYDEAREWMQNVMEGNEHPGLTPLPEDMLESNSLRYGHENEDGKTYHF